LRIVIIGRLCAGVVWERQSRSGLQGNMGLKFQRWFTHRLCVGMERQRQRGILSALQVVMELKLWSELTCMLPAQVQQQLLQAWLSKRLRSRAGKGLSTGTLCWLCSCVHTKLKAGLR